MEVDPGIEFAIDYAVRAGVFRRAARLNPAQAGTWAHIAAPYSQAAERHLASAMARLGVAIARPAS